MYHMNGDDGMGDLTIYQSVHDIRLVTPIWIETGNHSDVWLSAEIDINQVEYGQVKNITLE